jgi:hypothetical protein
MMNEFEQTLLFAATGVVLVSTIVVFAVRYFRDRNDRDGDGEA